MASLHRRDFEIFSDALGQWKLRHFSTLLPLEVEAKSIVEALDLLEEFVLLSRSDGEFELSTVGTADDTLAPCSSDQTAIVKVKRPV